MTARWISPFVQITLYSPLQWRGGHVTARCTKSACIPAKLTYLQWRGGHVTARWAVFRQTPERENVPSMEGRSRDRPMRSPPVLYLKR